MPTKTTTNSDILNAIVSMTEELGGIKAELVLVKEQVKYTNGQVKVLNSFKDKVEAVESYKNSQPTIQVNNQQTDWPKILLTVLGLLGTALAIIATAVSK